MAGRPPTSPFSTKPPSFSARSGGVPRGPDGRAHATNRTAGATRAIRSSGFEPWSLRAGADAMGDVATGVVAAELRAVGDGRIAVIVPAVLREPIVEALRRGVGEQVSADTASALDHSVAVFGVAEVKGLEFDSVLVVEPAAIVDASPRGANDLYVALTRTTNRLG